MTTEKCPYCKITLTTSLRFCVNCRRSIPESKKKSIEASRKSAVEEVGFSLGRRTYSAHRGYRIFFYTLTTLITIFLLYFVIMKFVLDQPMPGSNEWHELINTIFKRGE